MGEAGHGQASDIEIQAAEILRMRTWLEQTLSKHSNKTIEEVNRDIDRDKIISSEEAVVYGLVDQVLTTRKRRPGSHLALSIARSPVAPFGRRGFVVPCAVRLLGGQSVATVHMGVAIPPVVRVSG